MVVISETSDDGSNGGDPNKNPKELKKNLQEEQNHNKNPQEPENLPIPQELPQDVIRIIVALVRRCHYPKLSLISKAFSNFISSEELYNMRLNLSLTEPVLYALIGFPPIHYPSWYILHRSNNDLRLSSIDSIHPMLPGCAVATLGHKIYAMGGYVGLLKKAKTAIVIDCRSHTFDNLPDMQRERTGAAAGVIDGKIYVVGGRKKGYDDYVEVFDIKTQTWETLSGEYPDVTTFDTMFSTHVVLEEKIYILDHYYCLAYEPRRREWDSWGFGTPQGSFWHASSCVIDNRLYTIDTTETLGSPIVVYDPVVMVWRPVKGVGVLPNLLYPDSKMAKFGGKLVILGWNQSPLGSDANNSEYNICCIEIVLDKRENGEIWGQVEAISDVDTFYMKLCIELCRTVTV